MRLSKIQLKVALNCSTFKSPLKADFFLSPMNFVDLKSGAYCEQSSRQILVGQLSSMKFENNVDVILWAKHYD